MDEGGSGDGASVSLSLKKKLRGGGPWGGGELLHWGP
jgi:hypothetical protein